jgi:parallel beta-helix repeat protein
MKSNNARSNDWSGIYLSHSGNNTMIGNNASNNYYGIYLSSSRINAMIGNNASNNWNGISLSSSSNNTMSENDASNNWNGIYLSSSRKNMMIRNNASNNWNGVYLSFSSNNTLNSTNASSNNNCGIFLDSSSNNNKIYNNIFNNTNNVYFYSKINTWNTTRQSGTNIIGGSLLGGNFWANPKGKGFSQTCKDVNGDGICDSSRTLDANNIDYLPITKYKIPPKSVSKLKNVSYASAYINWTWTDPMDADFDKVKIYIDNIYRTSVMKGVQYYKAKNLYANRSYTISTRTVDKSGNLNLTWKNNTARTKPDLVHRKINR